MQGLWKGIKQWYVLVVQEMKMIINNIVLLRRQSTHSHGSMFAYLESPSFGTLMPEKH